MKDSTSAWLWNSCKWSLRQGTNSSGSCSTNSTREDEWVAAHTSKIQAVGWQAGRTASHGAQVIWHHIQGGPHSGGSSRLGEAAHLVLFWNWQFWYSSCALYGWSAHCCHATGVGAFADDPTPGLESSHTPLSMASLVSTNSPVHWVLTLLPLALPMSDIKVSDTLVGFSSLTLIIGTQSKKCDHSSDSVSDDQHDKRACIRIKVEPIDDGSHGSNVNTGSFPPVTVCDTTPTEGNGEWNPLFDIRDAESDRCDPTSEQSNSSSGGSLPPVQPGSGNGVQPQTQSSKTAWAASHSPGQPALELTNPPSSNADSNDVVVVEDSGSMGNQDRDSIMGVNKDDTVQDDDKSDSESDLHESISDSSPESAMGDDCLTRSDTEKAAVKSAHKRFHKKVRTSCSPTNGI